MSKLFCVSPGLRVLERHPVSHRRSLCLSDHTGGGYDHYGFYPVCLCLFFHGSAAI
ncbi:hypothetical protein ROSINTL182_07760 [Roseburia intestinalis L1-82]|uniref:Uncharacterized protein n=1 Tax=Roseburia intestinalis L1-82 TaxID=536231 RepID=C7GCW0_9FIRM|nr:hypothetical protein ROSINTL182_07760 [Roseburia intestinalis L1-82]